MSFVAAAVYSGYKSKKGAKAQTNALGDANQVQWDMYSQSREDQMPWIEAGRSGLDALMRLQGFQNFGGGWQMAANPVDLKQIQMQMDPGYQFRLGQGQDALQNSMAARGGALGGNALKAIADYGQNAASAEYGNVFNRLAGLSNVGQTTTNNVNTLGQNTANNVGNNLVQAGQARASGYAGQANAFNNMLDQQLKVAGMFMGQGGK